MSQDRFLPVDWPEGIAWPIGAGPAEHAAAETVGKAVNPAEKDREHEHHYADASEARAEELAVENEDLTNNLAGEEETRQSAQVVGDAARLIARRLRLRLRVEPTADAGWLLGEGTRRRSRPLRT